MLIHITPRTLDNAWPLAEPMLREAVGLNQGEALLDQVRMQVAFSFAHLLLWQEQGHYTGAGVVEVVQFPNVRVAYLTYLGGRAIVNVEVLDAVKAWCREQGASEIRGFCGSEAHVRLYERVGCEEIYRVMRVKL